MQEEEQNMRYLQQLEANDRTAQENYMDKHTEQMGESNPGRDERSVVLQVCTSSCNSAS